MKNRNGASPSEVDEWVRDPSVRAMRRVFAAMEAAQRESVGWRKE
jgi:hypothetical protein